MDLARLVHRIVTDPGFAVHFQRDSKTALADSGLCVTEAEIATVRSLLPQYLAEGSRRLATLVGDAESDPWAIPLLCSPNRSLDEC